MRQTNLSCKENELPFQIQSLEIADQDCALQEDGPMKLTHFEFIWIKKGTGSLTVDFQEYSFSENAIYCLSPGQIRQIRADGSLEGYLLCLSGDFYFTIKGQVEYAFFFDKFSRGRNITLLTPEDERLNDLNDIIQLIVKEYDRNGVSHLDILSGFLNIFMLYLSKALTIHGHHRRQDSNAEKVIEFLNLVKKNFLTKKMVAEYASQMALTPCYLNNIVKKISGFSASYHIQQCIMLEAKRQVVSEKMRLKELAYHLGFNDYAHFSKYFKNNCGMNFTSFRNGL
jgi:AraC family transcriptional activator of pobA